MVAGQGGDPDKVTSPTFVLMNVYLAKTTIYHFDTYRLKNAQEFLDFGGEETMFAGGICLVEWPRLVRELLPEGCIWVTLEATGENVRQMQLSAANKDAERISVLFST
jgi:tRNA threonylcarbamoyladenosine biosynthesis protein TsaE